MNGETDHYRNFIFLSYEIFVIFKLQLLTKEL